jgi:signal peptidase I
MATAGSGREGGSPYTPPPVRTAAGCLFELVETVVLTVVIFLVIQTFVAQPYKVEQHSMETTLLPDQYVLVDKLTPRFNDYSRGDVVVFEPPAAYRGDGTPFIKRIIGLPGDHIDIHDGAVYVDEIRLDEPYVRANEPTEANGSESSWVIQPGSLFVLGDNRENSSDSRVFGPVLRDSVVGRAWLRYWPLNAFGVLAHPAYPDLPQQAFIVPYRLATAIPLPLALGPTAE